MKEAFEAAAKEKTTIICKVNGRIFKIFPTGQAWLLPSPREVSRGSAAK